MSRNLLVALAAFAVLTFSAAGIGSAFTARSVRTWYPTLRKPPGNPPASYFGLVWTVLYCLMTLAAWNVWRIGDGWSGATPAITIFLIQLALNAVWSAIFFGLRSPRLGRNHPALGGNSRQHNLVLANLTFLRRAPRALSRMDNLRHIFECRNLAFKSSALRFLAAVSPRSSR